MNTQECIAKHLYDTIVEGKYKLEYLNGGAARVSIHKNWWSNEDISVQVYFEHVAFVFRGVQIKSPLAKDALKLITDRDRQINNASYNQAVATLVHDLKLECKDE
jgi:hypothetical protein